MLQLLDRLPLSVALILGLGLGLSPFVPEPHLLEKLRMLAAGTLTRPLDMFDLAWHGLAFLTLPAKLLRMATRK